MNIFGEAPALSSKSNNFKRILESQYLLTFQYILK